MPELDRPGDFKARILSYGLTQSKAQGSHAMGINCRMAMTAYRDPETDEWLPWEEYDQQAYHTFWFRSKIGSTNAGVVEGMCAVFPEWNGDIADFGNGKIGEVDCEVTVAEDPGYGYKVKWVNPPGGSTHEAGDRGLTSDAIREVNAAHGAEFRAIVGNVRRNKPKPNPPAETADPAEGTDDIPF